MNKLSSLHQTPSSTSSGVPSLSNLGQMKRCLPKTDVVVPEIQPSKALLEKTLGKISFHKYDVLLQSLSFRQMSLTPKSAASQANKKQDNSSNNPFLQPPPLPQYTQKISKIASLDRSQISTQEMNLAHKTQRNPKAQMTQQLQLQIDIGKQTNNLNIFRLRQTPSWIHPKVSQTTKDCRDNESDQSKREMPFKAKTETKIDFQQPMNGTGKQSSQYPPQDGGLGRPLTSDKSKLPTKSASQGHFNPNHQVSSVSVRSNTLIQPDKNGQPKKNEKQTNFPTREQSSKSLSNVSFDKNFNGIYLNKHTPTNQQDSQQQQQYVIPLKTQQQQLTQSQQLQQQFSFRQHSQDIPASHMLKDDGEKMKQYKASMGQGNFENILEEEEHTSSLSKKCQKYMQETRYHKIADKNSNEFFNIKEKQQEDPNKPQVNPNQVFARGLEIYPSDSPISLINNLCEENQKLQVKPASKPAHPLNQDTNLQLQGHLSSGKPTPPIPQVLNNSAQLSTPARVLQNSTVQNPLSLASTHCSMNNSTNLNNSPACNNINSIPKKQDTSKTRRTGVYQQYKQPNTPFDAENNIAYEIATMTIGSPVKKLKSSSFSGDGSTAVQTTTKDIIKSKFSQINKTKAHKEFIQCFFISPSKS